MKVSADVRSLFVLLQQLGKDAAVPLSNSIHIADKPRIDYCIKQSKGKEVADVCPFRNGLFNILTMRLVTSLSFRGILPSCDQL